MFVVFFGVLVFVSGVAGAGQGRTVRGPHLRRPGLGGNETLCVGWGKGSNEENAMHRAKVFLDFSAGGRESTGVGGRWSLLCCLRQPGVH